jgi:hypothetical protein
MTRDLTPFRLWLQRTYMEHKDEAMTYGFEPCDADTYFRMYKYWLKREYRHQQKEVEQLCDSYLSAP